MPRPEPVVARAGPAATGPARGLRRNLLGIGVSIACLAFIFWQVDVDGVKRAIAAFHWPYFVPGLLALAAGYFLRVVRWRILLNAAGARVSTSACAAPFLGSIALNNVLPLRLGDVMRALVFPASLGVSRTTAGGSLVMERLVDLLTLLACLAVGLAFSPVLRPPEWMRSGALLLALAGVVILALIFALSGKLSEWLGRRAQGARAGSTAARLLPIGRELLSGFDAMSKAHVLLALFGLSALVWVGEAGLYWAVLAGFGLPAGVVTAVVVMAIVTLSTLVPSSPGYVGPFHLAAYAAVGVLGGTPSQAAAFAVLAHLGVWLPTTLVGALAILARPQLFGRRALATAS